jgi:hypothetical protein
VPVLLENELLLEMLREYAEVGRPETDDEKLLRVPAKAVALTVELIGLELGGAG